MEACLDTSERATRPKRKRGPRPSRAVKFQVLTHQNIDGRLRARKKFDAIARGIAADLGGEDRLSTVQKHLVEGFASIAIHVNNLTAKLLRGEEVDIVEHSQAISTMVRVATRVGVHHVPRDVTPSLSEYLETIEDEAAADAERSDNDVASTTNKNAVASTTITNNVAPTAVAPETVAPEAAKPSDAAGQCQGAASDK